MQLSNCSKTTVALTLLAVVFGLLGQPVGADTIHESATLGPTGQTEGWRLDSSQFIGSRFRLNFVFCCCCFHCFAVLMLSSCARPGYDPG